ncbi:MAG TPA: HD domain-containing phosphohydrolase [Geobacteraceae bacterium]
MKTTGDILAASARLHRLADVDAVLRGLARLLKRTVKSRWIAVYLLDREQHDLAPVLVSGIPSRYVARFRHLPLQPERLPLLKTLRRSRRPVLLSAAVNDDLLPPEFRKLLARLAVLAVPLTVRNNLLGVVLIARGNGHPAFTDEETAVIRDLAANAALVVSHIRLFDDSLDMSVEMAKRIDIILSLDEINKAISSSLSPGKIIDAAMVNIERIVRCELVAVLVEKRDTLLVMASRGERLTIPPQWQPGQVIDGRCLAASAYGAGKSRYAPNLGELKRIQRLDRPLATAGIATLLATPLISKGKPRGVLLLGDTSPGQFVREDAFTIEKVAAQMAVALENARHYEELRALFIGTITSLANTIDAKSPWTKGHSERVMRLAATIAEELGLDEEAVERVRFGGLLHDIGKIGVIEAVLEKPAQLSDDEFPPLRLHPEKGVAILAPIEQLQGVLPGILHHHEHYDGSGYPAGLKGEEIPLEARIITVADAFDAMISERPYKKGYALTAALEELRRCAGSQFDPRVVACLADYLDRARQKKGTQSGETP